MGAVTVTTGDTRSRIKTVALDLFLEQGYEGTSLREIAERLGVTKAALYYHFKSKDDIVDSFIQDRLARLDALIAWARERPLDTAGRREVLRRYLDEMREQEHHRLMHFFEQNRPAIKRMPAAEGLRERIMEIIKLVTPPDARPADRVRAAVALFAIHSTWFVLVDADLSDDERADAAREVAYELIDHAGAANGAGQPR
jgi:AcrR family transcriptional regulator